MISHNFQMYTSSPDNECDSLASCPDHIFGPANAGIRYDILKVLYAGMLLNFTPEKIRLFWKEHPLPQIKSAEEITAFKELLHGRSWYNTEYVLSVFSDIEDFLIQNGKNVLEFLENSFYRINQGLLVSPRSWLAISKPVFKMFFTEPDIRVLLLSLIDHYLQYIAPVFTSRIVSHISEHDWNTTILSIDCNFPLPCNCSTTALNSNVNKIDIGLWFSAIIKKLPECFGLPRFEHQFMVADCREISSVVDNVTIDGNLLYINNQLGAEKTSFGTFCANRGIDSAVNENTFSPVWVMRSDYLCPVRKRVVLHQGCAYGAPAYFFGFHYLKLNHNPDNFMDSIIDDIVNYNDCQWTEIKELHNKLVLQLAGNNNFTYNRKSDTMQLNGVDFIKNVPAKILRKILCIYLETGRTEFYHSEFTKDESIIDNPYQPNFSIRLKRLMTTIENSNTSIELQKLDKGKFIFRPVSKISYCEIN